jgi:phage tail sheath protein FI
MPQYFAPGVYVEEVPSAIKAIAGVSTSTAGFIGVFPDTLTIPVGSVTDETIGAGDATKTVFDLPKGRYPVSTDNKTFQIRVNNAPAAAGTTLTNDDAKGIAQVTFTAAPPAKAVITGDYITITSFSPVPVGQAKLCTNFTEFKKFFGDFSTDARQRNLAHAVYGFFNNGGSRCYVMRVNDITVTTLAPFEAIDEIALVAAPGITSGAARDAIVTHCRVRTQDRFAIFDSEEVVEASGNLDLGLLKAGTALTGMPPNTDFAAFYFPWIQVFDPATKITNPRTEGLVYVPPSGHVAGIYARVDTERGVHKAPANEVVLGALGLKYAISKAMQDGLNPQGINVIREMNGNIRTWGARTIGGDANADLKYINVRRTLLFIRESIDEGTQWVVFEPNTPALWQKITRNVTAFLLNVWRSGALFGTTAAEAFYVKCDAETNPPELRELGQVVTEVGVALVRPAEFVIFRISQWAPPSK